MRRADLTDIRQRQTERTSSKGNQAKWKAGDFWYKADFLGYEALAEVVVSDLLAHSNVPDFCRYELVSIRSKNGETTGCVSRDFLRSGETLITLERLGKMYRDASLGEFLSRPGFAEDRINVVLNFLSEIGIRGAGEYLTMLAELDALTLNDDRHTNNIAFLVQGNGFSPAPVFDNGAAFLSNTGQYPLGREVKELIRFVDAKPFSTSFDRQKKELEQRCGTVFRCHYTMELLRELLDAAVEYYDDRILRRMETVVSFQLERYPELMNDERNDY